MPYITPEKAQEQLLYFGVFPTEDLPSVGKLERILERLEVRIDTWLGYHAPVKTYQEKHRTNHRGTITLRQFPVIDIERVMMFWDVDPLVPEHSSPEEVSAWWRHDTVLYTTFHDAVMEVTYQAGLDPLPRQFELAVLDLVEEILKKDGDTSFLDEAYHAGVSSLGVPGINKSWQLGKVDNPAGGTNLDKYLGRYLETYRRKYVY